jgi:hypothetical protein
MQRQNVRAGCISIVVAIAGGLVAAVGLSLFAAVVSAILEPESFGEQQFVAGFAFTIVLGMVLGSVTSLVVRLSRTSHRTLAGWIAVVGGAGTVALAISIAWGSAFSGDGGAAEFFSILTGPWIGPGWLGGAALLIRGALGIMKSRAR